MCGPKHTDVFVAGLLHTTRIKCIKKPLIVQDAQTQTNNNDLSHKTKPGVRSTPMAKMRGPKNTQDSLHKTRPGVRSTPMAKMCRPIAHDH